MSLINREDLMLTLGITDMDCEKCGWYNRATEQCKRGSDFEDACCAIENAPTIEPEPRMDKYGYIGIETLLNFCENSKDHSVTPNDFMRMKRVQMPERKKGKWIPMVVSSGRDSWQCSVCGRRARGKIENLPYCHCGAKMEEGEQE